MYDFVLLLRTIYTFTRNGQLDPITILTALLSKEPYHELSRLLLKKYLESPNTLHLIHDVNYQNAFGWSLCHFAAYSKNVPLMNICIEKNANLMITDQNGNTPLHIVIQVAQKTNSFQFIDENGNSSLSTIDKEKQSGDYLKIVELILNQQTTLTDHNHQIPYYSTSNNENNYSLESIKNEIDDEKTNQRLYLVDSDSLLVNKKNLFGKTPLHYNCFLKPDKFSIELLKKLLKAKANADITDFRQCTPLYYLLAEHEAEHRSKNYPKKCSKNCSKRSPFIDLLTSEQKCDRLNLDELDYGITSLKQLCRKTIQRHLPKLKSFHLLENDLVKLPISLWPSIWRNALLSKHFCTVSHMYVNCHSFV